MAEDKGHCTVCYGAWGDDGRQLLEVPAVAVLPAPDNCGCGDTHLRLCHGCALKTFIELANALNLELREVE